MNSEESHLQEGYEIGMILEVLLLALTKVIFLTIFCDFFFVCTYTTLRGYTMLSFSLTTHVTYTSADNLYCFC